MKRFCSNCGAELPDDSVFCESCGVRVEEEPARMSEQRKPGKENHPQKTGGGGFPKTVLLGIIVLFAAAAIFYLCRGKGTGEPRESQKSAGAKPYYELKEENDVSIAKGTSEMIAGDPFIAKPASGETKATETPAPETTARTESTSTETETEADTTPQGQAYDTVTGGTWTQVAATWFYIIDDEIVTSSWGEDNGNYYFVDELGHMLTDCYTPDGYYVGPDGAYDPDADYGIVDIDTQDGRSTAPAGGSELAARLSTEDIAYATDFEWFLDCVLYEGNEAGRVITGPDSAMRITDDALSLNGGWKAFMCSDGKVYGSDVERYFHVMIDTDGDQFMLTANWKYMYDPAAGNSIDETHTDTFKGKYQNGTATAQSTYAQVDFDGFYLSADGKTEYATGTFHWISGEQDRIGLMRSVR